MVGQQSVAQAPVKVERRERPPQDVAPPCPAPMRPCLTPGCHRPTERARCAFHERLWQAERNRRRGNLYDGAWQRHSRERRAEVGRCMEADATCKGVLSVDHPTDDVLCLSHHDRREAQRRRNLGG